MGYQNVIWILKRFQIIAIVDQVPSNLVKNIPTSNSLDKFAGKRNLSTALTPYPTFETGFPQKFGFWCTKPPFSLHYIETIFAETVSPQFYTSKETCFSARYTVGLCYLVEISNYFCFAKYQINYFCKKHTYNRFFISMILGLIVTISS